MWGHPSKPELWAYAEGLVDGRGISSATARHVSGCAFCRREVESFRKSIELASAAPGLNPPDEFVSQILVAARHERKAKGRMRPRSLWIAAKSLGLAASVTFIAAAYFQSVLDAPAPGFGAATVSPARQSETALSVEDWREAAGQIRTLAAAVGARMKYAEDAGALQQARRVLALDAELMAAQAAAERNPGGQRPQLVINSNLRRQTSALKALYVGQTL
jgi:hypothetical protein